MIAFSLSKICFRITPGKFFFAGVFSILTSLALIHPAWSGGPAPASKGSPQETLTASGKLIVKFRPAFIQGLKNLHENIPGQAASQMEQRLTGLGTKLSAHFESLNITLLETTDSSKPIEKIIENLMNSGLVEYAEPDGIVKTHLTPNDAQFDTMWNLHNTFQLDGVDVDADIDAPEAWDIETGDANNVVIVLDTGVDHTHQDLQANMWVNPGEIVANGVDDDGNGYVDDIHGIDVYNNDSDPMDDHGHGTHVSGTLGAVGNNGVGVVGVNHSIKIIGCKFLNAEGEGLISGAIECLDYAQGLKLSGVPILLSNNSWGCLESEAGCASQGLQDAIEMAGNENMLFVAAAGNEFLNSDAATHLPSGYDLDNIMSVAATDEQDLLAFFSNFGLNTVDLGAPGVAINSTLPGNQYSGNDPTWSGTSMASPHVAGAAALVWAKDPSLSYSEVKRLLMFTTDQVFALDGITVSGGRLNAFNALSCTPGNASMRTQSPRQEFSAGLGQVLTVSVILQDCGVVISGATVIATPDNTDPAFALHDDGIAPDQAAGDGIYSAPWLPVSEGDVILNIQATKDAAVYDASINGSISSGNYVFDDQVGYSWIDPSAGGIRTSVWGSNDDYAADTIFFDFDFVFYGVTYNSVIATSDGHLGFGGRRAGSNNPMPFGLEPAMIAPFWDDLIGSFFDNNTDGIWYRQDGAAPNRTLTIAWINASQWPLVGEATFEVILYEGSNDIKMQYKDVEFAPSSGSSADYGATATVGVQNQDGSVGAQYSHNSPSLCNGCAIMFSLPTVGGHSLSIVGGPSGSPDPVDSGGQVQLGVNAVDDQGHSLSYLWSDYCGPGDPVGSFSSTTIRDPIWTAPVTLTANETCTISVTVDDGLAGAEGRSATASYSQTVTPPHSLSITTPPSGLPDPVASEGTVNVTVDALDSHDHAIAYSWSASCGSFANSGVKNPQWTAPLNNGTSPMTCTLTVDADDGLGQSDTASYVQTVLQHTLEITDGPRAVPSGAVASGDSINLTVAALDSDPGHSLSYFWSDGCGGNFNDTHTAREPFWTAPNTASSLQCTIGVTVFDGASLSVTAHLFQDVVGSGGPVPDTTAPTPDPMSWASPPAATGTSSISMTATTATDDTTGVEYLFECVTASGGCDNSAWQASPIYSDTGLSASTSYTYRVQARDLSSNNNMTAPSGDASAMTDSPPPPPPVAGSMDVSPASGFDASGSRGGPFTPDNVVYTLTNPGDVDVNFTVSEAASWMSVTPTSGTLTANGGSVSVTVSFTNRATKLKNGFYTDDVIFTNTTNSNGDATHTVTLNVGSTPPPPEDTTAPSPDPMTLSPLVVMGSSSISMTAATATDPSGVEYFFDCVSLGCNDSVWQSSSSYTDSGLNPDTLYTYQVQARDLASTPNYTGWSNAESAMTEAAPTGDTTAPTPDPMTWDSLPASVGKTSITMTARTATDASGVEYLFDCVSAGCNDSGWQASPIYTDTGLSSGVNYTYRVQARDLSANNNTTAPSSDASATTCRGKCK